MLSRLRLDGWSKTFLTIAMLLTLGQVGLLVWSQARLPPQVPLFYSLPWGEDRLGSPIWLWVLPALSLGAVAIDLLGSHLLRELVLTRILASSALLVSTLSIVTLAKITLLGLP